MPIRVTVSDYSISPTPPTFVAKIEVVYEPVVGAAYSAIAPIPGLYDISLVWQKADFDHRPGATSPLPGGAQTFGPTGAGYLVLVWRAARIGLVTRVFRARFDCKSPERFGPILAFVNTADSDLSKPPAHATTPYRDVYIHVCAVPPAPPAGWDKEDES